MMINVCRGLNKGQTASLPAELAAAYMLSWVAESCEEGVAKRARVPSSCCIVFRAELK